MTINTQAPSGGPDLSFRNPRDRVYVQSDNEGSGDTGIPNTKDAFRFRIIPTSNSDPTKIVLVEGRPIGRAWNPATLRFSGTGSAEIGPALSASATGRFIKTTDKAEPGTKPSSLIPETPFNADGSAFLEVPVVDKMQVKAIFPGPATSEIINTTISQQYTPTTDEVVESATHQTGTFAATLDVQYTIYAGPTNTDPVIFQFNFPASDFAASQPALIDFGLSIRLHRNLTHLIELTSVNSFSLETNAGGDILTDFSLHDFKTLTGVTDNFIVSKALDVMLNKNLEPMYTHF